MQCPQCGFDNPTGMNFCGKCANPLAPRCPQCGFENPPGFAFCGKCATSLTGKAKVKRARKVLSSQSSVVSSRRSAPRTQPPASYTPRHLAERIQAEREAMEARGAPDGERKTITALFADLKGSTALIEDLDPEDARKVIDPALQLMMEAVHRYEGYVAQSLGDGIFALFGAPIAHEDHAHRALYAALRMQEEMRRYGEQRRRGGGAPLLLRVGINTGEVVVRSIRKDDLQTEYVPVGHSTNIAARMENLATPGSIVVSEYTYKLTEGYFDFKALGETQVKGISAPLGLYEVVGVSPLRTKMQVAARRGLARFVGRQSELEQLRNTFEQAKTGHGQIVGVMGEPGVGKSRLFYEFKLMTQVGCLILETFSVSHGKAYPYLPLIDLLKNYFQLALHDDERQRREKITGRVLMLDRSLEDILPYLFFLLGIAEATSPLQQMDPQIRRKRTLEAIRRLLVRESLNQPVIVIFEDLHWLDAETQAFLSLLSESVATAHLLLLVNYRPEYRHEWGSKTYYTQLRLDPLGREQAEEMLTVLLGDVGAQHAVPLRQFILDKTEGNPFFMEEIVQELRERGVLTRNVEADFKPAPTTYMHIPPTVQAVLAARIDRLPHEEKALLQTLAVIGKEFSLSLIKQVVSCQEEKLQQLLFHLRDAEFIYEQPAFPDVEYIFKHALTQEVAYNSMLIEQRKIMHERTAKALEEVYCTKLDDHYSALAHHYSRSGNTQKAVDYLQLAGQQAVQRSANTEAISHLTVALELLKTLPDTPERTQKELTLQLALGAQIIITKGYTVPEVEGAYSRAHELCGRVGETSQRFAALLGLWTFAVAGGNYRTGHELADQLMGLARTTGDPAFIVEGHEALAWPLFWSGEIVAAHEQVEQGITLYDPAQHGAQAFRYWQDPKMACLSIAAWAAWELGYPDLAYKRSQESLTLARELAHTYNLAAAFGFAAMHAQLRREAQTVREQTEIAIALATEHGFPQVLVFSTVMHGWALSGLAPGEEGIVEIRWGLDSWRETGAKAALSWFLAILAETYANLGQPEEGLQELDEAFAHVHKTNERFYEAELYRLKGELVLQKFQVSGFKFQVENLQSEAEECFLKAIEISRKQQAKSLELRARMSLARLRQQQGKKSEAHKLLGEIYNWFTEGFDTKDLQEAKMLLEELSH